MCFFVVFQKKNEQIVLKKVVMIQPYQKYFVSLQHDSCENAPARQMRTCSLCTRLIASLWR